MKTCIHDDCVVVWEEYQRNGEDRQCPLCEAFEVGKKLQEDNERKERQIDDLEEREV